MSTQRTASLHHWTCSTCPFSTSHPGALGTHSRACERRKRKRDVVADDLARQEALIRSETHDDAGRKLWRTAHNDLCEVCGKEGSLLLCSYCNTSWHLQCTGEQFVEAPEGYWMCGMCVEAEREGDDMTHHGLPGEDDEEEAPVFDRSVDADDEDGETDISEAAYEAAGILPFPPSIWDATTADALRRALAPHPSPLASRATCADTMLNRLRSKHALSLSVMVDLDEVIAYLAENPDETVTPARERSKILKEELQQSTPTVPYEVRTMFTSCRWLI